MSCSLRTETNRWAGRVFVAVAAAAFVYYLLLARREWFFTDEWDFLANRGLSFGDLMRAHVGHLTALPIVVYRFMWWSVGLRSYLPYVALTIALHLTIAALLRVVMLRAGVRVWIATAAAIAFVCFGPGAQDVLWAFQITFSGAVALGLVDVLLIDHSGPVDRRDWYGLAAGTLALLCSGVAVTMVIVVGIAALLRRGWRCPAHTAPLGVAYLAWWFHYARDQHTAITGSTGQFFDWVTTGLSSLFGELGRVPGVGWILAVVLIAGSVLAVRERGPRELRGRLVPAVALLVGALVFFVTTGFDRSGLAGSLARSGRYLHVGAALLLPALAVAIDAILRRSNAFGAIAVAALLVGIPGNVVKAHDYLDTALVRDQWSNRQVMLSVPRALHAASAPASLRPDPDREPTVTLGWLRAGIASGRVPKPRASTAIERRTNELRLSLMELDRGSGYPCHALRFADGRRMRRGERIGIVGAVSVTLGAVPGKPASSPVLFGMVLFNGERAHTLVALAGPLQLHIAPVRGTAPAQLCIAPGR